MSLKGRPRIDVVGLGPAGPELTGKEAADLLGSSKAAFLRTHRHPAAAPYGGLQSFDYLYQAAQDVTRVYVSIVGELVDAAMLHRHVVYAVPGSPSVAERTVELLVERSDVEVVVHPATSFLDLVWIRLGVDPLAASVRLIDGERFTSQAAGQSGPLLVAQCWSREILSGIKLAVEDAPSRAVTVLQGLGTAQERCFELGWDDLDRGFEPDHLTSIWVPEFASSSAAEVLRLEDLAVTLRRRCPWDAEQSHGSLARYLREEAFEALDAIVALQDALESSSDPYGEQGQDLSLLAGSAEDLREELGDLLYQVVFHSVLAQEEGLFSLADVARGVHDKLYSRHPHVFGDEEAEDADAVMATWEERKKAEKGRSSRLDGIPSSLPALAYAQQLRRRASSIDESPEDWVVGELLFAVSELASKMGVDAEAALRSAATQRRDRWRQEEVEAPQGQP